MEKVPPTQKSELEKSIEAIKAEEAHWHQLGLDPNFTVHSPASVWHLKLQVRALYEALTELEILPREKLDTIFNKIALESMQKIRKDQEQGKTKTVVPRPTILDPFGREMKI